MVVLMISELNLAELKPATLKTAERPVLVFKVKSANKIKPSTNQTRADGADLRRTTVPVFTAYIEFDADCGLSGIVAS